MADNTILNVGSGGDTVRDLARQSGSIKTQVLQLDLGGASANAEVLITAGPQLASVSVPVVSANIGVGAATFAATQVPVGVTATSILSARTGVAGTGRIKAKLFNTGTIPVYIGGSGVTTSTGFPLLGGTGDVFETTAALYGIVSGGSVTVGALELF